MRAAIVFIVLVLALVACFGPKHPPGGPQGTNPGPGSSSNDGPWSGGGTTAALGDPAQR